MIPRTIKIPVTRTASEGVTFTVYRANPVTFVMSLDSTRPTVAGAEFLRAEIRLSQTDLTTPLAVVEIADPDGVGPFDIEFTGAQMNQDLGGLGAWTFWLVIYTVNDAGETLDIWHTGKLKILEHAASQMAGAPPNVVAPLSQSTADSLYAPVSYFTFHTSSVATSDTDLSRDSVTAGADQTTLIQAMLDVTGPKRIIVDGRYTVTTLLVDAQTTIEGQGGGGFKSAPGCEAPILQNRNMTKVEADIEDEDISLINLVLHGNAKTTANPTGNRSTVGGLNPIVDGRFVVPVKMFGVRRFMMQGCTTFMSASFSCWVQNSDDTLYQQNHVDQGPDYRVFADGIKFSGRNSRIRVLNNRMRTSDDAVSFCPNEGIPQAGPEHGPGPIIDALVDGLDLYGDWTYGCRILSSTALADKITLRRIRGTCASHLLVIDNYTEHPEVVDPPGAGNVGRVIIEDCDVQLVRVVYQECYIKINCPVAALNINRMRRAGGVGLPTVVVGPAGVVNSLIIDGYICGDGLATTMPAAHVDVYGSVQDLRINKAAIQDSSPLRYGDTTGFGTLVLANEGAAISRLVVDGLEGMPLYNITADLSSSGQAIASRVVRNGANLTTPLLTSGAPRLLPHPGDGQDFDFLTPATLINASLKRAEQCPADILLSADIRFTSHGGGGSFGFTLREPPGGPVAWAGHSGYVFSIAPGSSLLTLGKNIAGANTSLGTRAITMVLGAVYHVECEAVGTRIAFYVRRPDGGWLQPDAAWGPYRVAAIVATDSYRSSGVAGVYNYSSSALPPVEVRNFRIGPGYPP